ncbi:hypothetical protein TrCOL_g10708 [Triparma columacea]|uniref:Uncharacterized protein n=1 Tax=Triparma columacea TaxID=722753 RepID=A0A9W7L9M8_9STRA|nr:hypothetical protein TrCOL_g10708 [Triparma columacea]
MKIFISLLIISYVAAFNPPTGFTRRTSSLRSRNIAKDVATMGLALTIATSSTLSTPAEATQVDFGSPLVVAEKVTREGVYGTYDVDLVQTYDNADSTFKSKVETKSKKGKYTALLGVLVMGSFIIPMAQYFWYVKDDDSSDNFFAKKKAPPPPPPPPPKKGFRNPFAKD